MSHIEDLISHHCPNGVEYMALADVADIKNGSDYKHLNEGSVPVYGSGGMMDVRVCAAAYDKPTVLLPRKGSISNVFYVDEPFWNIDTVFYTVIDTSKIAPRYFYHVMLNAHIERYSTGSAARPSLTQTALKKIKIPVPPLEVQDEIVRILDSYTQLEQDLKSELEAELDARRKQYEYYRDSLLSLENLSDYPGYQLRLMKEVAEIRSGWGFPKKYQGISSGEIPFFKVSDMNTEGNGTQISIANNYVSECVGQKLKINPAPAQTIIFPKVGAAIRTNKKRITAQISAYDNNIMGLIVTDRTVIPKYLFHWMQTVDLSTIASDSGALPSITKARVEKMKIPVPPMAEQERIVAILDKFDALVNDLSSGLPAEIAARRKQYEYYRDQLLTFTPAK